MKIKQLYARLFSSVLLAWSAAEVALAQPANQFDIFDDHIADGDSYGTTYEAILQQLGIDKTFGVILWVITAAAIINLIYAGFQYITAGGDKEKSDRAKRNIIFTIVGIVVTLSIFAIYLATNDLGGNFN